MHYEFGDDSPMATPFCDGLKTALPKVQHHRHRDRSTNSVIINYYFYYGSPSVLSLVSGY